jgi:hypothetical protein
VATNSTDEFLQAVNQRPAHSALLSVKAKVRSSTLDGAGRLNLRCYDMWLKARQGFKQRVRAKINIHQFHRQKKIHSVQLAPIIQNHQRPEV